ncbi:sodium/hydrogen exchanger 3 isoform X3 [Onthophagus taurus]|uniref:sodium/hydrogen exchanger 3 isoform X3 n=1 Tax=Onthophagus taurus TaxID=166361 RepID=UPI000C204227|nr:sodium/hydrogen exchanger 3 isoform X3 [Onthophagus taurus]
MYSLRHGVNLARRACWTLIFIIGTFSFLLHTAGAKPSAVAEETFMYPRPDLEPIPDDYHRPYEGMEFGPMGPPQNKPGDVASLKTEANPRTSRDSPSSSTTDSTDSPDVSSEGPEIKNPTRYPVFSVSFHRVETPFIIGLWIFCASIAKIGFHMAPRLNEIFPESCLLIVVGVVIGVVLVHLTDSVHMSPLTPETFFFYMLPPIILDAGYFMPNRLFFDHLGTILLFAVIGTIFNTLTIGTSLWAVGCTGLYATTHEITLLDMLLFSSLISAVDPVAVLAVFEEIQVNEILYIVVFGESLLNDAVTVVLYHMFESYSEMGLKNILYTDLLAGFANFFVVAFGGTVIGIIWGFATGFVTRFTNEVRVIEPIFIFVMAYLAYLNAEIFHMSGILAITFCGITMKNYVEANISHKSHTTIKYAMKMLSSSSETIIFMFLGVATVNKEHDWNTWFVILTIIFCSIYRTLGVILLTALANRFRLHQLNKVEKFVMSYGGLRGAVAFALVLLIKPNIVKLQPMFMTTTIAVVYFTVFFQGITIKPLVKLLNVKTAEKRKPTMNERIHERLMDHTMAAVEDILGQHGNYHVRDRFKRFDNKFIRPYLLRNYQGHEPKILETYSKLAMKDAMEYMRRNASTIGNISGTESMSAIFKNYTSGNLNGRCAQKIITCTSFSQLDSSTWNIDMQELEYNPSKKDLTDAKIHHLLAEELCKPYKRVTKSYSRHAVNDRDLSTQVNYKMHFNTRRMVNDKKHHHKRHSKKLHKDGKQNHVSFPEFQQNGSAKQFTHDYINEVLHEDDTEPKSSKEEWDSPITFTAKSSPSEEAPASSGTEGGGSISSQQNPSNEAKRPRRPLPFDGFLPWRRERGVFGAHYVLSNVTDDSLFSDSGRRLSKASIDGVDLMRVTTPTATESVLPWKRDDETESSAPLQQSEFPAWASNKEYLAYNSPSATFLGGLDYPRSSVIGLFRRESTGSGQISSAESSPQKERRGSAGPNAILLIEDGVTGDPLGVLQKTSMGPTTLGTTPLGPTSMGTPTLTQLPAAPQTPGQRRQARRGSMLELSGSITHDTIPEEGGSSANNNNRRPSWFLSRDSPKVMVRRQPTFGETRLVSSSTSTSDSSSTSDDEEIAAGERLMKPGL